MLVFFSCSDSSKIYNLKFFNIDFTAEGKRHLFNEEGQWKIYNFLQNSVDSGEYKDGVRYGDWTIKKRGVLQPQNWTIVENSEFKLKTNIPFGVDSLKYSDYFIKVLLNQNDYLSIVTFIIDNPDNKNRKVDLEDIFIESNKFFLENKYKFDVKRMNEKKGFRAYYLDEYLLKDSLNNQFYYLHFYTRLNSGKLFEVTCKGNDNFDSKILSYKIIMNTFLENERVYSPFIF